MPLLPLLPRARGCTRRPFSRPPSPSADPPPIEDARSRAQRRHCRARQAAEIEQACRGIPVGVPGEQRDDPPNVRTWDALLRASTPGSVCCARARRRAHLRHARHDALTPARPPALAAHAVTSAWTGASATATVNLTAVMTLQVTPGVRSVCRKACGGRQGSACKTCGCLRWAGRRGSGCWSRS